MYYLFRCRYTSLQAEMRQLSKTQTNHPLAPWSAWVTQITPAHSSCSCGSRTAPTKDTEKVLNVHGAARVFYVKPPHHGEKAQKRNPRTDLSKLLSFCRAHMKLTGTFISDINEKPSFKTKLCFYVSKSSRRQHCQMESFSLIAHCLCEWLLPRLPTPLTSSGLVSFHTSHACGPSQKQRDTWRGKWLSLPLLSVIFFSNPPSHSE